MHMRVKGLLTAAIGLGLCQQVMAAPITEHLLTSDVTRYNDDVEAGGYLDPVINSFAAKTEWNLILSGGTVDPNQTPNTIVEYQYTGASGFNLDYITLTGSATNKSSTTSYLDLRVNVLVRNQDGTETVSSDIAIINTADPGSYSAFSSGSDWFVNFTATMIDIDVTLNQYDKVFLQFFEDENADAAEKDAYYFYYPDYHPSLPSQDFTMTLFEDTSGPVIPEPATLALLGFGLMGLGLRRKGH